jgi:hypothetical protein
MSLVLELKALKKELLAIKRAQTSLAKEVAAIKRKLSAGGAKKSPGRKSPGRKSAAANKRQS